MRRATTGGRRRALRLLVAATALACAGCGAAHPEPAASGHATTTTTPSAAFLGTVPLAGPPSDRAKLTRGPGRRLGPWKLQYSFPVYEAYGGEGLTTLERPGRPATVVLRGTASIPESVARQGWTHIGNPGSWGGYLFDAYQSGGPAPTAKMFRVTTPSGATAEFVHRLVPGEEFNNSFAAVTPNGKWLVSGEWGTMSRFLVFPTPLVNPEAPASREASLPLAATVDLERPVRDVQGCTFFDDTTLLCSTDDPGTDLWPTDRQLLEVTLAHPLTGATVAADVESLGELPQEGSCKGAYEVEGIDYERQTGDLLVEVTPPGVCSFVTTVYDYRR